MTATPFPDVLRAFTVRYRAAVLTRAMVRATLALGLVGALAWRLHALPMPLMYRRALPALLAGIAVLGAAWWARHHWMVRESVAAHLDRVLGLQQRLVTAAEFSSATETPTLYPLLVEDAAQRIRRGVVRFPTCWDRTTGVLAVALLLAWLWPSGGHLFLRVVHRLQPAAQPPGASDSATPPPPSDERASGDHSSSATSSPAPNHQGADHQPPSSGVGQSSPPSPGGSGAQSAHAPSNGSGTSSQETPQSSSEGSASSAATPHRGSGSQPGGQGRGPMAGSMTAQEAAPRDRQPVVNQQQAGQPSPANPGASARPSPRGDGADVQRSDASQSAGAGRSRDDRATSSPEHARVSSAQASRESGGQQQAGGSGGRATADQDALKGDIQKLLKEMSGELETLQGQLSELKNQPSPAPGSGTDAKLFGSPESFDHARGGVTPIQLQTDGADVAAHRPGGGTGQPSGTAEAAAPTATPEAATLSEQPLEERSASRDVVPPEYRDVWDRLHRARTTQ